MQAKDTLTRIFRAQPLKSLSAPSISWISVRPAWRDLAGGLVLGALLFLFLSLVQFSTPDLADNDGFYHIKLAELMRMEGLKPAFTWLPLSLLNAREFYDHHFLFHVAMMPFTLFGDLRLGAKWAAVVFATLAFLSVWSLLKHQRIPYAWLWTLGLAAVSEAFIFRMSIPRAQSLSLAILMLALDWLLQGKHLRLAGLAFVYVWTYDAFPLLPVMAGIHLLAVWAMQRRLEVRPLIFITVGTLLGVLINPYFPHNVVFTFQHLVPKLVETTAVSVGNEWYPYDTGKLLENSPLALAAFVSGGLALGLSGRRIDIRTLTAFALAGLFGLMTFQARRFIEYFPAFALVFAAFAWAPVLAEARRAAWSRWKLALPAAALAGIILFGAWNTYNDAKLSMSRSKPYETYAAASSWLSSNTPAGSRVFQTDWDDFPRLFYYNTHNTYLIGLDPTYMQLYDEQLYQAWVNVTRGEVQQPSGVIRDSFAAAYVITDHQHEGFLRQASGDPGLVEVYQDDHAVIFQVTGP